MPGSLPVIIDMDGGIDDALAIMLGLLSPEIEVVGITSISGNVPVSQATLNALRVVELLDRSDVWVARGLARPLARKPIRAFSFHGRDGLGDSHLPRPRIRPSTKTAMTAINETLASMKNHGLTIVCTGPLTNIATLLTSTPQARKKIRELIVMGGAYGITQFGVGNETAVAEFNIYSDPEAAKVVFEAGVRVKAIGLDVTMIPQLELSRKDYARIRNAKGRVARFAARILEKSMRSHGRFTLHDPMALAVAVKPSFYNFADYHVTVETEGEHTTGMTVTDRRSWLSRDELEGSVVSVCEDVDPGFKKLFLNRIIGS